MEVPEPVFAVIELAAEAPEANWENFDFHDSPEHSASEQDIDSISLGEDKIIHEQSDEEESKLAEEDALHLVEEAGKKDEGRFIDQMVQLEKEIKESQKSQMTS